MKKMMFLGVAFFASLYASEGGVEKVGFLTTESCAKAGAFTDCRLENYFCGHNGCYKETEAGVNKNEPLVLFSHNDGVIYKLETTEVIRGTMDKGINRNEVTIVGEFDASSNTIVVSEFKAPPPPKKSFFKGCL